MLGGYRIDPYGGLTDCPFSNMADNLAMLVEAVPPHGALVTYRVAVSTC